jgi:hypothetical protein
MNYKKLKSINKYQDTQATARYINIIIIESRVSILGFLRIWRNPSIIILKKKTKKINNG